MGGQMGKFGGQLQGGMGMTGSNGMNMSQGGGQMGGPNMSGNMSQMLPDLTGQANQSVDAAAVGGLVEMSGQIAPLPQMTITNAVQGGERLVMLKTRVNELGGKVEVYRRQQVANGGVAVASAVLTFGTSLLVQGPAAVHLNNQMNKGKRAISECLGQINKLRQVYGNHPDWWQAEQVVHIQDRVFVGGISRSELKGPM